MRKKLGLIALDLDNTLLNGQKELTQQNLRALEQAAGSGVEIVPATGRFYNGMPAVVRELPFVHYAITINGAAVYDVSNGCTLQRTEIRPEAAVAVMEYLDRLPVVYDCYLDDGAWMTRALYERMPAFAPNPHVLELVRTLRTQVDELKAFVLGRNHGVQKVQAFFQDMELRKRVLLELPQRFPSLAVTASIVNNIEINAKGATKGNALRFLCGHLRIPLGEAMAFGDDLNDLSMIEAAGTGVAMGNAHAAVREAADAVTKTCDENGVAAGIYKFCMMQ